MLQPMIFANKTHTFTFLEIYIYASWIKVKWALGSITMNKAMEVMEFQLTYFKS